MNYELNKYIINNMNRFKNASDDFKEELARYADTGNLGELFYAEKRNAELMPTNFKGYDLSDKTEIKTATSGIPEKNKKIININGLKNKDTANLIIILYNDLLNKVIAEITIIPDDIKKVDGNMPESINVGSTDFRKEFADKTKILARY